MLPKNMTDAQQVMDLVVNGPLKAVLRRRRSWALFAALQAHRLRVAQAASAASAAGGAAAAPLWAPPKPRLADGLHAVCDAHAVDFATPAFRAGMRRSFVSVGLAPVEGGGGSTFAPRALAVPRC